MTAKAWTWEEQFAVRKQREEMRTKTREQAEAIMKLAGFAVTHTWELANCYWPDSPDYDDVRKPWWLFLTEIGPVQIGWRKRVLHLQWSACAYRGVVTDDDVTKTDQYVHAYSPEKAIEYLRTLRERATAPAPSSSDGQPNEATGTKEKV